jgi:hypothetical protein
MFINICVTFKCIPVRNVLQMKQVESLRNAQANCPSRLVRNIPAGERGRYLNGAIHADEMRTGERDRSADSVKRRKCRLATETSYYPKNNRGSHRFSLIRSDPIIQDGHISITHIYGTSGDQCLITSRLPVSARMSERKALPSSTTESKHRQAHYLGSAY